MKKTLRSILLMMILPLSVSAQSNWSMGLQLASVSNNSTYLAGMTDANGRFNHGEYSGGAFSFLFRYKFDEHWNLQTGLGFVDLGFNYSVANDYSLLHKSDQFTANRASFCISQIPLTAIYTFKPNCRNFRYFLGAGANFMMNSEITSMRVHSEPESTGNLANTYVDQVMYAPAFAVAAATFTGGIEKILKKGNMLQLSIVTNHGFTPLATSTVKYNADGVNYNHTFTNNGTYWGLAFAYYFKPFGSGKAE